jgi:hypothetical protein
MFTQGKKVYIWRMRRWVCEANMRMTPAFMNVEFFGAQYQLEK